MPQSVKWSPLGHRSRYDFHSLPSSIFQQWQQHSSIFTFRYFPNVEFHPCCLGLRNTVSRSRRRRRRIRRQTPRLIQLLFLVWRAPLNQNVSTFVPTKYSISSEHFLLFLYVRELEHLLLGLLSFKLFSSHSIFTKSNHFIVYSLLEVEFSHVFDWQLFGIFCLREGDSVNTVCDQNRW